MFPLLKHMNQTKYLLCNLSSNSEDSPRKGSVCAIDQLNQEVESETCKEFKPANSKRKKS